MHIAWRRVLTLVTPEIILLSFQSRNQLIYQFVQANSVYCDPLSPDRPILHYHMWQSAYQWLTMLVFNRNSLNLKCSFTHAPAHNQVQFKSWLAVSWNILHHHQNRKTFLKSVPRRAKSSPVSLSTI